PEKPNNEKNLNNVPLTDNLTSNSNVSDVNLVERQQRQVLITHAGLDFFVSSNALIHRPGTLCTLGFAAKGVRGNARFKFDHGFLVLGGCLPSDKQERGYAAFHVRHRNQAEEVIRIGSVGSLKHEPASGLSYALVRLLPNNDERVL
ncbi:4987_t:CDS:1, partial [Paraglomus brasilianum]